MATSSARRIEAIRLIDGLSIDLDTLCRCHERVLAHCNTEGDLCLGLRRKTGHLVQTAQAARLARTADAIELLIEEVLAMRQLVDNFDQQVAVLQGSIQVENSTFTTVSNVMKTKHDTVKNNIANIR